MAKKKSKQPTLEDLYAVRRVLELLDGYMSVQKPQHRLMAWEGGLMTWAEIREHAKAAIKLLPKEPTS